MTADGEKKATLIGEPVGEIQGVGTCPDGSILVNWFDRPGIQGSTIWRINSDGSSLRQLTHGTNDSSPTCAPDGNWVYYLDSLLTVLRVPINGGEPETVASTQVSNLLERLGGIALSRDGRHLAVLSFVQNSTTQRSIDKAMIVDLNPGAGTGQRLLNVDQRVGSALFTGGATFTPDGNSIAYAIVDQGVWNLWLQPLDGSPGHLITDVPAAQINDFRWSPDGRTLAVAREFRTSDVVLFRQDNP